VGRTVFGDVEDDTDSCKDMVRTNFDCPRTLPGTLFVEKDGEEGETHRS
jgi:hypothetical protein